MLSGGYYNITRESTSLNRALFDPARESAITLRSRINKFDFASRLGSGGAIPASKWSWGRPLVTAYPAAGLSDDKMGGRRTDPLEMANVKRFGELMPAGML